MFSQAAVASGKIVCNIWAPGWLGGPGSFETESDPHLALFHSMDRCFAMIAAWNWREALRGRGQRVVARIVDPSARSVMADMLAATSGTSLTEREAKEVMKLYGIPIVADALAQSASAARDAAVELGFPVVLKGESPDILHKTEAGLVKLNLESVAEVEKAFDEILSAVANIEPKPDFRGVVVQLRSCGSSAQPGRWSTGGKAWSSGALWRLLCRRDRRCADRGNGGWDPRDSWADRRRPCRCR